MKEQPRSKALHVAVLCSGLTPEQLSARLRQPSNIPPVHTDSQNAVPPECGQAGSHLELP